MEEVRILIMAEKRMFSNQIIDSDAFLDMPATSQNLYFHLAMRADDEGFINSPKKIMRSIGANENDFDVLVAKGFLIGFESKIYVIKHWWVHNYIRQDRVKSTNYTYERSLLNLKENGAYTLCQSSDSQVSDKSQASIEESSIDKNSLEEDSIDKESVEKKPKRFIPPTLEEIETFIKTNNLNVNAKYFLDYFTDGNWIDSKGNKVKNWKQKLRTWHNHNDSKPKYRTLADSNREAMDAYEKRFSNDVIEGEVCEP